MYCTDSQFVNCKKRFSLMEYFVGIDPGKTGAIAFLSEDGTAEVFDFPDAFSQLVKRADRVRRAYLEQVHAMPGQGVVSTFSFGENYGWWQGVLMALRIPFLKVRPQDWQKNLVPKKGASDKPSLEVARQLFPDAPLGRKKDHNRADALLIAYVCRKRECL